MRRVPSALRSFFSTAGYFQKGRFYGTSTPACWNCKKQSLCKQNMICANCRRLQDVNSGINYFELLDFPTSFAVEGQKLTQRFRQLQGLVHPDKSTREQNNSADWSSLINKAYKTLSKPLERGQYMLELQGEQMPQDNTALNKAFLMDMMERNEEVEDAADSGTLEQLNAQIIKELDTMAQTLSACFEVNDLAAVKATLVEMKYLLSIQSTIKKKLQRLMGNN
ncbi:iron-sulfur cluster co-chaperone protein HscB isoform X2 [Scaptodrosophila lebanonensis]|uniref:Iron-sulfur cluster co-chaperone protein HscB isoform X2 n=1 Tax=Drosophila lebanonensis TaxID=7225 RepID=A0A6J2UA04_DROLE|nr:iron-sulfur cluster co-chaperone protein HscB isoform X2 [Scaptodrosophila lebanonensis]